MREIKFRVWDLVCNGYAEENWKYYLNNGVSICDTWCTKDDIVLEQFTGLLDKNGVEIYEGDIVIYDSTSNITNNERWTTKGKSIIYQNEEARFKFNDDSCFGLIYNQYEVIGNIHESKHLL